MNELEQSQKIERYVLNRMDEDEATEFEAYYLSNQDCLEQLEASRRLHQGLQLVEGSEEAVSVQVSDQAAASNDSHWWKKKLPAWSLVASVMMMMLPTSYLYQQVITQKLPQPGLSVVNLSLSATRSAHQLETIMQQSEGRTVVSVFIDIELQDVPLSDYGFILKKQNTITTELSMKNLKLDSNDMLYVDLGDSYLLPGTYDYEITGSSSTVVQKKLGKGKLVVK